MKPEPNSALLRNASLQGLNARPFRVVICGIGGGIEEVTEAFLRLSLAEMLDAPVEVFARTDIPVPKLFAELQATSVDLIIVINVMAYGGKSHSPAELLSEIYERTHKPIIGLSGMGPKQNQELEATSGFAVLDMPFTRERLKAVLRKLLTDNGYTLK